MGLKKWLQRLQPAPLYLVLVLSVVYFLSQMVICHVTHSLTLLVDANHMLCNIIALIGCIMTLKYESKTTNVKNVCQTPESSESKSNINDSELTEKTGSSEVRLAKANEEKNLRNTFGWARIDVLMLLIVSIFFVSLSYSVMVEALQTLIHINHKQVLSYPLVILIMGVISLCLNSFCFILIGGYTYHQESFIHLSPSGKVVLDVASVDSVQCGERHIPHLRHSSLPGPRINGRGSCKAIMRDATSGIFVIICGLVVYFVDIEHGMYVDPVLTIVSALFLLYFTVPYMKESGLILLQTIPDSMNIETLHSDIMKSFPTIVNIHDLHVWQLTTHKVVLTMHIIFIDHSDYSKHFDEIKKFILDQGVTEVTIQPELKSNASQDHDSKNFCLMKCKAKACDSKHCCNNINTSTIDLQSIKCTTESNSKVKVVPTEVS